MKKIGLVGIGNSNAIFDESVRDGCWHPWLELKNRFGEHGYELMTKDLAGSETEFDVHVNAQPNVSEGKDFLIAIEPPQIWGKNYQLAIHQKYRTVFTWNDDLVDEKKYLKLFYPNPVTLFKQKQSDAEHQRDIFACMIAGNKAVKPDGKELYSERLKVIRWYEKTHPNNFSLYGVGWDTPAARGGLLGKVSHKLMQRTISKLNIPFFSSYRGKVDSKASVLNRARFGYAFENVRGLPGYITEKIFDCFFAGCVPVYWGADNITDYVPKECFIDRRDFGSQMDLHEHLSKMGDEQIKEYRQSIVQYINSDKIAPFSSEYFANHIANSILSRI